MEAVPQTSNRQVCNILVFIIPLLFTLMNILLGIRDLQHQLDSYREYFNSDEGEESWQYTHV